MSFCTEPQPTTVLVLGRSGADGPGPSSVPMAELLLAEPPLPGHSTHVGERACPMLSAILRAPRRESCFSLLSYKGRKVPREQVICPRSPGDS